MKKIVFIMNTCQNPRCLKRINEFIDNGYEVEVYGFSRKNAGAVLRSDRFTLNVIGEYSNELGYLKRIPIIVGALKKVFGRIKEPVIFYYFGYDIAFLSLTINRRAYIYEESDLMHTYIRNAIVRNLLEYIDQKIINNSFETIFTSEGFLKYHYGNKVPRNVSVIPNRLNKTILSKQPVGKKTEYPVKLKVGFVGVIRFKTVYEFVRTFLKSFPEHEFHFYGTDTSLDAKFESLKSFGNVFFHGSFRNPDDLPEIYSNIDLVLATYDVSVLNVRYAEPNKIYEAVYFNTPIIVSKGTFLAEEVEQLGVGYWVNPSDAGDVVSLVDSILEKGFNDKTEACKSLPPEFSLNNNEGFFVKLNSKMNNKTG